MECAYHPDKEAVAECSKCGRPLCEECSKNPNTVCIDCSIMPAKVEDENVAEVRLMNWDGWINSFVAPKKAFKTNNDLSSSAGIAMNLFVGLINAGILAFIMVIAGKPPAGESAGSLMGVFGYTTQFIIFLCIWLVTALVSYSFAMLTGGMGNLKQHLYLFSLLIPLSPLVILILAGVFGVLLSIHISILFLGVVFITIYFINIIIAAIEEAHRFGFLQAAVSGIIPVIIIGVAIGLLILAFRK